MLEKEQFIKFFLLGFSLMFKKIVANIKLAFTNVSFKYNLACVIQKGLTFKRVIITVR